MLALTSSNLYSFVFLGYWAATELREVVVNSVKSEFGQPKAIDDTLWVVPLATFGALLVECRGSLSSPL